MGLCLGFCLIKAKVCLFQQKRKMSWSKELHFPNMGRGLLEAIFKWVCSLNVIKFAIEVWSY